MNEKHKLMAYVLHTDKDFKNTQQEIAALLHVKQPTISNAIKDAKHMVEMKNMHEELVEVKRQLLAAGIQPTQMLLT